MREPASGGRLHALLVGVDRYAGAPLPGGHNYPSLAGCVRDVERVAGLLEALDVPAEHIVKLTASLAPGGEPPEAPEARPTRDNLVAALTAVRDSARPGDRLWLHYSGHGGRATTLYPEVKGEGGLDEGLVPWDIVRPETDYLRDVEISHLLRGLVEAGVFVTLVLDCCHSGGATRGPDRDGVAVRGVDFVDTTPRRADDLVAPRERLIGTWRGAHRSPEGDEVLRQAHLGQSWTLAPEGYVLLAACRPQERALELTAGGRRVGVLTHHLLEVLGESGTEPTFVELHARLLAAIHTRHVAQTPMLEGEGERGVFGLERWPITPGLRVLEVDGEEVRLDGGRVQGLAPGATLALRPERGDGPAEPALVEVVEAAAASSRARLVEPAGASPTVLLADRAVLVDPGPQVRTTRVAVEAPGTGKVDPGAACLRALRRALAAGECSLLTAASPGEVADLTVVVTDDGALGLRSLAATPLPNAGPPVRPEEPGAVETILDRLVHLARYGNVRALTNPDPGSAVQQGLVAELVPLRARWKPDGEGLPDLSGIRGQRVLEVPGGSWVGLRVEHRGRDPVNVAVLDLQPDWGITQIYPSPTGGEYHPLDPGVALPLPIRGSLPPGCAPGPDVLKVFATRRPTRYRWLELPALGEPVDTVRATPRNPLERLLAATADPRVPVLRSPAQDGAGTGAWGVTQVELVVR